MSAVHCLSCDHDSSPGAAFCQRCGSALNLKLCMYCEAINDSVAQSCHSCATPFAALPTTARAERVRRTRQSRVRLALAGALLIPPAALLSAYLAYREPGPERTIVPAAATRSPAAALPPALPPPSTPTAEVAPLKSEVHPAPKVADHPARVTHTKTEPDAAASGGGTIDSAQAPRRLPITHTRELK